MNKKTKNLVQCHENPFDLSPCVTWLIKIDLVFGESTSVCLRFSNLFLTKSEMVPSPWGSLPLCIPVTSHCPTKYPNCGSLPMRPE